MGTVLVLLILVCSLTLLTPWVMKFFPMRIPDRPFEQLETAIRISMLQWEVLGVKFSSNGGQGVDLHLRSTNWPYWNLKLRFFIGHPDFWSFEGVQVGDLLAFRDNTNKAMGYKHFSDLLRLKDPSDPTL